MILTGLLLACGGGTTESIVAMATGSAAPVEYRDTTLVVKGVPFGTQRAQDFCGDRASASASCYQARRVGLWVRHSNATQVDADLLIFGLAVIERTAYACGGDDRAFWSIAVPGGFELQWLLALRFFLTIVSSLILPAPLAPSDPYSDPSQVVGFICTFARAS